MKIGVVKEGFAQPNAEADVNAEGPGRGRSLEALGAKVSEVSIPMHLMAGAIWMPIGVEGTDPDHDVGGRLSSRSERARIRRQTRRRPPTTGGRDLGDPLLRAQEFAAAATL